MGRLPCLPLAIFERAGVAGHQSLARDRLAYRNLTTDREQRAYVSFANTTPLLLLA